MYFRKINNDLKVSLTISQYANEIFCLIDNNRYFFKQWLPWIDKTKTVKDTKEFIQTQLSLFQKGLALHETIFYKNKIVGVLALNKIDIKNDIAYIGYWLAKDYNNKGIMIACVKNLIKLSFEYYDIDKIEIRCAIKNKKSQNIPIQIGFKKSKILEKVELVNGRYLDHIVYELKKEEFLLNLYS